MRIKPFQDFVFTTILFLPVSLSCNQKTSHAVINKKPLQYDTSAIAMFENDTGKLYLLPQGSGLASLTQNDLGIADSLFNTAVNDYNNKQRPLLKGWYKKFQLQDSTRVLINPKKYRRQYFAYTDSNGQKIIYINCFCNDHNFRDHPNWKKYEVIVDDGGNCYFELKVNIDHKKYFDFFVNGQG